MGQPRAGPEIYQRFFSDAIANKVDQAVAQSGGDMAAAVQGLDFYRKAYTLPWPPGCKTAGDQLPEKSPHCWSRFSCRWCRSFCSCCSASLYGGCSPLLVRLLRGINGVPLVGGVNRLLGLALGLCTGALDCWLLALVLWFLVSVTAGGLDWLNTAVLQRSVGYSFWRVSIRFSPLLNIFEQTPPKLVFWQGLFDNSNKVVRRGGHAHMPPQASRTPPQIFSNPTPMRHFP